CPVELLGVTSAQGVAATATGERYDTRGRFEDEVRLMSELVDAADIRFTVAFSAANVFSPDYGVRDLPHVVVIDSKGIVRERALELDRGSAAPFARTLGS